MYHLIPRFIESQSQTKTGHGHFEALTMFLDISGFTPMTQALMRHGKVGAEILSDILNQVFEPVIGTVYEYGGFISSFAGDAFTALFPVDNPLAVCSAAQKIGQYFETKRLQQTAVGEFLLVVKMGLSAGDVEWGIVGEADHQAYYFRGSGIDACVAAEAQAQPGQIIIGQRLQQSLDSEA